jgi:WD40 repeat protein
VPFPPQREPFCLLTGHFTTRTGTYAPPYSGGVTCFAWAPDDSVIAQCDVKTFNVANPTAELDTWDPRTGRLLHTAHSGELIGTVAFSPDSRRFVYTITASTSGRSGRALDASIAQPGTFVYDTRIGAPVISFPEAASAASFSPDGSRLAYATIGDNFGHVYEFDNGLSHVLIGQPSTIDAINFNRAGTYVVTAGDDGTARVYDASNGNLLEVLAGHKARIRSATFGLEDTEIATTSYDGTTRLWTTPDPRPSLTLPGRDEAATIGFTADGSKIVEAERSGQGRILSARDLHLIAAFRAPVGDGFAGASASHDGRLIARLVGPQRGAFAYPVAATTYGVPGGGTLARMAPSTAGGAPISGALDPAGDRLLTAGANGSADAWDPRTGTHLSTLRGTGLIGALAYSSDGRTLAILHLPSIPTSVAIGTQLGNATVEIWDARSGRHLRSIDTHTALQAQIPGTTDFSGQAMAFSPDGRRIALVGVDSHVELYLTSTGRQVGLLNPEGKFADSVAFSFDGKMLAIGTAAAPTCGDCRRPARCPSSATPMSRPTVS